MHLLFQGKDVVYVYFQTRRLNKLVPYTEVQSRQLD